MRAQQNVQKLQILPVSISLSATKMSQINRIWTKQNLISFKGGQDTSACWNLISFLYAFPENAWSPEIWHVLLGFSVGVTLKFDKWPWKVILLSLGECVFCS